MQHPTDALLARVLRLDDQGPQLRVLKLCRQHVGGGHCTKDRVHHHPRSRHHPQLQDPHGRCDLPPQSAPLCPQDDRGNAQTDTSDQGRTPPDGDDYRQQQDGRDRRTSELGEDREPSIKVSRRGDDQEPRELEPREAAASDADSQ